MQLKEVMTAQLETISAQDSLREACKTMKSLNIGVLPVVEEDRAVGLITDRDIVVRGIAEGADVDATPVRDVMTSEMWCLPQDRDVQEAARLMEDKQIRRILVLNEQDQIVGILSLGDLAVRHGDQDLSGEVIERVSEPSAPDR
jgi:CBS domain-containing protein